MFTPPSLPCPDSVAIHRLAASDTHFVIELTACRGEVPCPDFAQLTHRLTAVIAALWLICPCRIKLFPLHFIGRKTRYEAVVELHQQGIGKRAIARTLGLSRMTVRRYLQAGEFPEIASRGAEGRELQKQIDAHREYLSVRWEQGIRSGTALWNEIRARGFTGSLAAVYRLLRLWRAQDPAAVKNSVAGAALAVVQLHRSVR